MNELQHYGVLGMKWGIRKERLSFKTKSGDTISLSEHPSSRMSSFLAKHVKKLAAEQAKTAIFDIKDPNGKNVGDITLYKESPISMNVVWVTTAETVRGKGYGTAVMKAAIQIAKDTNCNQVTLEVPGSSPDAKHIYEKLGFKEVPSPEKDVDDYWGGLTNMKLDLTNVKHSEFSDISNDVIKNFMQYLGEQIDNLKDDSLSHFGILGMKWGVRRSPDQLGKRAAARAEKKDVKFVSKQSSKVEKTTRKLTPGITKELATEGKIARLQSGKLSKEYINAYNQKLASLMNEKLGSIQAPSGKVLRFVAKRGEVGVFTALADQGYNMNQLKSGLHASGRKAYSKQVIKKIGGG